MYCCQIISLFIVALIVSPGVSSPTGGKGDSSGNIVPGAGYSSDTFQILPQLCFNATISSTSQEQAYIHIDSAVAYTELQNLFGLSVGFNGKFAIFSLEAKVNYFKSVEDKDYSLSLNYYEYASNNVAIQVGNHPLTETGQYFYFDGNNPYFGVLCGDYFISSYEQGALLSFALNIKFQSHEDKFLFEEKVGFSFGVVGASEEIKIVAEKYNIHGSMSIQAFQMGGDPSQLSNILNKDGNGDYYVLSCDLSAMDNCLKTASGMLDYAKNDFSKQFSFKENFGLTPLGISFTQYTPIKYVGLATPPTLAGPEVVRAREDLHDKLMENRYYQQKVYFFQNDGYPVDLDSDFKRTLKTISSKANANVNVLMRGHDGGLDCLNFPDECEALAANINSELQSLTADLEIFESIKYTVSTLGGTLYNTGEKTTWRGVPTKEAGYNKLSSIKFVFISDLRYEYTSEVIFSVPPAIKIKYKVTFKGNATSNDMVYRGQLCKGTIDNCVDDYQEIKKISPFYFDAYRK